MPSKPQLTVYGDSGATYGGKKITDGAVPGDIDTSKLNKGTLADTVEFNNFEESVRDYVLARLGFPVIRVELTPFQIKSSIDEATTLMSYHAPMWTKQFATFEASAGVNMYELPQHIMDNVQYVVYKKTLLSIQSQAGTLEFDFFIKYFQDNFLFNSFAIGDFYLLQSHLEQIRKVLGQEGSWDIVNGRYLQLYPVPVVTPQPVLVEYRALDSDTIHPAYRNWIQKYTLAVAKGILGEIRSKYASIPGPGGGASLNGAALLQQSQQEKKDLEEQLRTEIEEPPVFTAF
jgi:uncharacterized protein YdhG (YjbR/CyaY superfamily)